MKSIAQLMLAFILIWGANQAAAQNATAQLNNIIDLANDIDANADQTQKAAKDLKVDYFSSATPNLSVFIAEMTNLQIVGMTALVDDAIFSANQAKLANPALDVSNIVAAASQIKMLRDEILDQALDLNDAVPSGNTKGVLDAVKILRQSAKDQSALAKLIATEASALL